MKQREAELRKQENSPGIFGNNENRRPQSAGESEKIREKF